MKYVALLLMVLALFSIVLLPAAAQDGICGELSAPTEIRIAPDATAEEITRLVTEQGILRFYEEGEYELALLLMDELEADGIDSAIAFLVRGCIALEEGDEDEAIENFESFLDLSEDDDLIDGVEELLDELDGGGQPEPRRNEAREAETPDELEQFAAGWEAATSELAQFSVIPLGGQIIFDLNAASLEGEGGWYNSFAESAADSDVAMGGLIRFAPADRREVESCVLLLRVEEETDASGESAAGYLSVGVNSDDQIEVVDNLSRSGEIYTEEPDLDFDEPVWITLIAQGESLSVWANGELIFDAVEIGEGEGNFGAGMFGEDDATRCEVTDAWALRLPEVEADECLITAPGTVNKRSGPGTNFDRAGQMSPGETQEAIALSEGEDGFVWWQLEDETWVRQDVVTELGYCYSLPEGE